MGDPRTPSAWIQSAAAGEATAVEHLCRAYEQDLLAYVERQMGSEARRWTDPEDIVQRALLETVAGLNKGDEPPDEGALIARMRWVARRRIQDALRAHRNDIGGSVLPEAGWAGVDEPSEGSVTRADTRRWLEGLVERLPDTYRGVVQLCALEGASYDEAAHQLGLSPESVRKRYERARDMLSQKLDARNHGERRGV